MPQTRKKTKRPDLPQALQLQCSARIECLEAEAGQPPKRPRFSIDGGVLAIVDVALNPTPTLVYNVAVEGTFTYFAETVWVHNKSLCDSDEFWYAVKEVRSFKKYLRRIESSKTRLNQDDWDMLKMAAEDFNLPIRGPEVSLKGDWDFPHMHIFDYHIGLADGVIP